MMRFGKKISFALFLLFTASSCGYVSPINSIIPLTPEQTKQFNMLPSKPNIEITPSETAITGTPSETATCISEPNYTDIFQNILSINPSTCDPTKSWRSIGIYVYDLNRNLELVSINAEVPFQFASAFKGPVLVYFLENCRQYWDVSNQSWNDYFNGSISSKYNAWYSSNDYKELLIEFLSDASNFGDIITFSETNREYIDGLPGEIDQRYFILAHVYNMVVQSNNSSTGHVLNFVYEKCLIKNPPISIMNDCESDNAISAFNNWFNRFSDIEYVSNEKKRGLYSWSTITSYDSNQIVYEKRMPTFGLIDKCADQNAFKYCSDETWAKNTYTAIDLSKFYKALYHLEDDDVRSVAQSILSVDAPGNARGYLKNMARKMRTTVMSKNGNSEYIISDAGIITYYGNHYVISVLSYNSFESLNTLFGNFDEFGNSDDNGKGLLQELIESRNVLK